MIREKVQGPSVTYRSTSFGQEVKINRQPRPAQNQDPSGDNRGQEETAAPREHREVIPSGPIGSTEGRDIMLPPPQYVDTVADYRESQRDPSLHNPVASERSAEKAPVEFRQYTDWDPRSAPIPRAAQDELFLEGYGRNVADPLMTDNNSTLNILSKEHPTRQDLFGPNRDGMLHNQNMVPNSDTAPYHAIDAVSEAERAQLSQRRGLAAAEMPHGEEQKQFIARQGDSEAVNGSRLAYNKMSLEAAEKGH